MAALPLRMEVMRGTAAPCPVHARRSSNPLPVSHRISAPDRRTISLSVTSADDRNGAVTNLPSSEPVRKRHLCGCFGVIPHLAVYRTQILMDIRLAWIQFPRPEKIAQGGVPVP